MKLIVGLGNPGQQYRNTRHNVGFRVLDEVAGRLSVRFDQEKYEALFATAEHEGERVMLLKPLTYMNLSGTSIAKAARKGRFAKCSRQIEAGERAIGAARIFGVVRRSAR